MSGARDDRGKKIKKVSIAVLKEQIDAQIPYKDAAIAEKLARFLIEPIEDNGKVLNMADSQFEGQSHSEAVTLKRRDL